MLTYANNYDIIIMSIGQAIDKKEVCKMEVKQDMGMTDKQFNGFVRFLLDALKEAQEEKEPEKKEKKLEKVIENLQQTLED